MRYLDINYEDIDTVLENFDKNIFLKNNHNHNDKLNFHVYWYGLITRKQILCIKSYLVSQNLDTTILYVWLDYKNGYNDKNIDLIPKHKNIIIKCYDPKISGKDTLLENKWYLELEKPFIKYRSDLARILILYKCGGIYYDLDMILLKDLSVFKEEFCYQWSYIHQRGNNGILLLKKNSDTCIEIMKKYICQIENNKRKFTCDFNTHIFNKNTNIICYPCALFDPCWLSQDTRLKSKYCDLMKFDNFFKKTDINVNINNFYNGLIYAYHWHSRNNIQIEKNSYFERIENDINNKILDL